MSFAHACSIEKQTRPSEVSSDGEKGDFCQALPTFMSRVPGANFPKLFESNSYSIF